MLRHPDTAAAEVITTRPDLMGQEEGQATLEPSQWWSKGERLLAGAIIVTQRDWSLTRGTEAGGSWGMPQPLLHPLILCRCLSLAIPN